MQLDVHHYFHVGDSKTEGLLKTLLTEVKKMAATNAELVAQVTAVNEKLTKIGSETRTLLTKVDELKVALDEAKNPPAELVDAVKALTDQAAIVDDLVPDEVPPTP